jgi:hypothetical protein
MNRHGRDGGWTHSYKLGREGVREAPGQTNRPGGQTGGKGEDRAHNAPHPFADDADGVER